MADMSHPLPEVSRPGHWLASTLRAVVFAIIVNPFAIAAAGLLSWLLAHAVPGVWHTHTEGPGWQLCDAVGCGACITALSFLTLLAIGHVVLTIVALRRDEA